VKREQYVLEFFRKKQIPIVILTAGGYGKSARETAMLHAVVFREGFKIYGFYSFYSNIFIWIRKQLLPSLLSFSSFFHIFQTSLLLVLSDGLVHGLKILQFLE
jgi:hypothetical protein